MEIFKAIVFWLFGAISLLLCLYCIFEKNLKRLNIVYLIFTLSITVLIFNLKSPLLAVLHGLIFGGAAFFILKNLKKLATKEGGSKKAFLLNAKTALSVIFGATFAFSFIPFVLYVFGGYKTQNPLHAFNFLPIICKESAFGLILLFVLLIVLTTGLTSILNFKNLRKKLASKENE